MRRRRYSQPNLEPFPPVEQADDDGLLAIGGDLSSERLVSAYSQGIFPWFEEGQPILWWSPDPRCVLYPDQFIERRSLRKSIRQKAFSLSFDRVFEQVIEACAAPRDGQPGTWITDGMRNAYCRLHEQGIAHSVEVWQGEQLVGGLYGVALGNMFYGESMFSRVSDASKYALKCLCEHLQQQGYELIDCQVESEHLLSLGAVTVPRYLFIDEMNVALEGERAFEKWGVDA